MKKTIYIITALLAGASLLSCQRHEPSEVGIPAGDGELAFLPTLSDIDEYGGGIGNNFFDVGYGIDVVIRSNNANASDGAYKYLYESDGTFRGNPGYRFTLDDNYIVNLEAKWPEESLRQEIIKDQSTLENHKLADWMTATATVTNVMPTDAPVPLNFIRDNTMLEFELAGQNTEGLSIDSLVIDLKVGGVDGAFFAYCGYDNGHAYLILGPGTRLVSDDKFLAGILMVNKTDKYYIMLPEMDLTLQKGTRYLVTLTPEGYDIDAWVFLADFIQYEGGIGIPFKQPTPLEDGSFLIETPQQLITMSYLIRHYDNPATFEWPSRTYVISDSMVMTEELAANYVPVDESINITDEAGTKLYTVEYGTGKVLQLYENDN